MGKYSCNRDGNVYRRRVYIGSVRIWKVPAELDGHAAFYLGVLVILGSAVAYTLFLKGVSLTGPVRASVLACLEPLTAACLSAVWLNSVFTPAELIGFVCIWRRFDYEIV